MNRYSTYLMFGVMVIALLISNAARLHGQERGPQNKAVVLMSGNWKGVWVSLSKESSGYLFFADLQMKVADNQSVTGKIVWILKKAPPNSPLINKIGFSSVEFVKGKFYPESNTLVLNGYKKEDPRVIIALDEYRLILSDDHKVLGGITASHRTWKGLISLDLKKK